MEELFHSSLSSHACISKKVRDFTNGWGLLPPPPYKMKTKETLINRPNFSRPLNMNNHLL